MQNKKISIAVVIKNDGKVLIILRRKKESGTDNSILSWTFPSGTVELDEDPSFTAERETYDETGYKIKVIELINEKDHPQFPVHVFYWRCKLVEEIQYPITEIDEIAEVRWVDPVEIPTLFTTNLDAKTALYLNINSKIEEHE